MCEAQVCLFKIYLKANGKCSMLYTPPRLGSHWGLSDSRKCWSHQRRLPPVGWGRAQAATGQQKLLHHCFANIWLCLKQGQEGWKTQMCRQIFVKCIDQSEDRVMTSTSQVFKDWVMDCKVQICILHNSITVNVSCRSTFLYLMFLQFASIHFFLERSKKFTLKMCILAEWRI